MVAGRPFYQRFPGDFIMGTVHMDLETRGAYSILIDLLNDRDRPIPDEPRFIAGVLNISVRKWNTIRTALIDDPRKLYVDKDGCLTNPRFERERARRRGEHVEAVENGRRGGQISAAKRAAAQGNFDLSPDYLPDKSAENGAKVKDNSEISDPASAENNDLAQAPPQAPRARVEARDQSLEDSSSPANPRPRAANAGEADDPFDDLLGLTERLARIGGVPHVSPSTVLMNVDVVKGWLAAGIDIEETVVKAIEEQFKNAGDQNIGSLRFYAGRVAKKHAQASPKRSGPATPIAEPIYEIEGEEPAIAALRRDLAESMGHRAYATFCNTGVTLERVDGLPIIRVNGRFRSRVTDHPGFVAIAAKHGFNEVW